MGSGDVESRAGWLQICCLLLSTRVANQDHCFGDRSDGFLPLIAKSIAPSSMALSSYILLSISVNVTIALEVSALARVKAEATAVNLREIIELHIACVLFMSDEDCSAMVIGAGYCSIYITHTGVWSSCSGPRYCELLFEPPGSCRLTARNSHQYPWLAALFINWWDEWSPVLLLSSPPILLSPFYCSSPQSPRPWHTRA